MHPLSLLVVLSSSYLCSFYFPLIFFVFFAFYHICSYFHLFSFAYIRWKYLLCQYIQSISVCQYNYYNIFSNIFPAQKNTLSQCRYRYGRSKLRQADISCLSTRCFRIRASTADRTLAHTVLHQIMICPPKNGGRISMSASMNSGSIKVRT